MRDVFTIAVVPDVHVPAHDPKVIGAICSWMRGTWIDALVQLGDLVDLESISRFVKDSPAKLANGNLPEEFALGASVLGQMTAAARAKNKAAGLYVTLGNHDERTRRLCDAMPMLSGMFDLEELLGVRALGGKAVSADGDGDVLRFEWNDAGKIEAVVRRPHERMTTLRRGVSFIHGWKHNLHNAKATVDQTPWNDPIVYGHVHTRQLFTRESWGVDKAEAVTLGWCGRIWPEYIRGRANRWHHGFGVVTMAIDKPGICNVDPRRITDGILIGPDGAIHDGAKYRG